MEERKKISAKTAIGIIIVILLAAAGFVMCISEYFPETVKFGDQSVKVVECGNFDRYVDKLNEVHYSDDMTLLDLSIPEYIIYKDEAGTSYSMKLEKDTALEKLNELKYSSEYKVQSKYLTLVVFYY